MPHKKALAVGMNPGLRKRLALRSLAELTRKVR